MAHSGFDDDLAEFEVALEQWHELIDACDDRAGRRALRKSHPAAKFEAPMRAHFGTGELRGANWCLDYLADLDLDRKAREALRIELYNALVAASDPGLRELTLERMLQDSSLRRAVKLTGLEECVRRFVEHEPNPDQRGRALYLLAFRLSTSRDEELKARGTQMLRDLLTDSAGDAPDTTLTAKTRAEAEQRLFALEHLAIGKVAPNFSGSTIDGEAVSLADTRGRVTVLSFFGFW